MLLVDALQRDKLGKRSVVQAAPPPLSMGNITSASSREGGRSAGDSSGAGTAREPLTTEAMRSRDLRDRVPGVNHTRLDHLGIQSPQSQASSDLGIHPLHGVHAESLDELLAACMGWWCDLDRR